MKRGRTWILALLAFTLLAAGGAALVRVGLPALLKARVERAFTRVESRFEIALSLDEVLPDLSGRLLLPDVRVHRKEREIARVEGIAVTLDPLSFLYGGGVIEAIDVARVTLRLEEGAEDVLEALRRPRGPRAPHKRGETEERTQVPVLRKAQVREIVGTVALRGNVVGIRAGRIEAELVSMLVDDPEYRIEGHASLADGNEVKLALRATRGRAAGALTFAEARRFRVAGQDISFRALHVDLPGRVGLEDVALLPWIQIERVAFPIGRLSGDLRQMAAEALQGEVFLTRPRVRIDEDAFALLQALGGSVKGLVSPDAGAPPAPPEPAPEAAPAPEAGPELPPLPSEVKVAKASARFHAFARETLLGGLVRLEGLLRRSEHLGRAFPLGTFTVEGGEVKVAEALAEAHPWLVSARELDCRVAADEAGVEALLEYRTESATLVKNRLHVKAGRDGSLSAGIRLDRVPGYPFQGWLPASVTMDTKTWIRGLDVSLDYDAPLRRAALSVRARASGLHAFDERVSAFDLRDLSLDADLSARIDLGSPSLEVERGNLAISGIPLEITGTITAIDTCPSLDLHLRVPRIALAGALARLPTGLLPLLREMQIKGDLELTLGATLDACDLDSLRYDLKPVTSGIKVLSMGPHIDFEAVLGRFEKEIIEGKDPKTGEDRVARREFGPGTPSWTPLEMVPPAFAQVLTTTEDGSFFDHGGFSTFQIRKALIQDLQKLHFYRGASTMSQQLVKNIFLTREKTLSRKLQEMIITWQMEETLTKEQILELYVNVIELGPNIYGIKEAARYYFCKRPRDLSLLECVFLASILPSPRKYHEDFLVKGKGRLPNHWRRYLGNLLEIMVRRGKISEDQKALQEPYEVRFAGTCDLPLEIDLVPGMPPPDTLLHPDGTPAQPEMLLD